MEFLVSLHVDASAALGIIERRGVGRVRHLDVGSLWIKEQQFKRIIELKTVAGFLSPWDLLTNSFSVERIDMYSDMIGYIFAEGCAAPTPKFDSFSGHGAARRISLDF